MKSITLNISEIPHGHGLSFKKGVANVLLYSTENKDDFPKTHEASYKAGQKMGQELKQEIAHCVKK